MTTFPCFLKSFMSWKNRSATWETERKQITVSGCSFTEEWCKTWKEEKLTYLPWWLIELFPQGRESLTWSTFYFQVHQNSSIFISAKKRKVMSGAPLLFKYHGPKPTISFPTGCLHKVWPAMNHSLWRENTIYSLFSSLALPPNVAA